jgi:hypothetical protein
VQSDNSKIVQSKLRRLKKREEFNDVPEYYQRHSQGALTKKRKASSERRQGDLGRAQGDTSHGPKMVEGKQ